MIVYDSNSNSTTDKLNLDSDDMKLVEAIIYTDCLTLFITS
jgi:hypothetical protein